MLYPPKREMPVLTLTQLRLLSCQYSPQRKCSPAKKERDRRLHADYTVPFRSRCTVTHLPLWEAEYEVFASRLHSHRPHGFTLINAHPEFRVHAQGWGSPPTPTHQHACRIALVRAQIV